MKYRKTKLYKTLTSYEACAIAEGFSGKEQTEKEVLTAWQWLVDTGTCWTLQGWYGRTAADLIEEGFIQKKINIWYHQLLLSQRDNRNIHLSFGLKIG